MNRPQMKIKFYFFACYSGHSHAPCPHFGHGLPLPVGQACGGLASGSHITGGLALPSYLSTSTLCAPLLAEFNKDLPSPGYVFTAASCSPAPAAACTGASTFLTCSCRQVA